METVFIEAFGTKWGEIYYDIGFYWLLAAFVLLAARSLNVMMTKKITLPCDDLLENFYQSQFGGILGKIKLLSMPMCILITALLFVWIENVGVEMVRKNPTDFTNLLNVGHEVWFVPDPSVSGYLTLDGEIIHGFLQIEGGCNWWKEEKVLVIYCPPEKPFELGEVGNEEGYDFFITDFGKIEQIQFKKP